MKTNDCTVYDELNNIRDYYDLLKVRFGQRIKFEFDIDEVTLTTHMPPMVLQPIVENSYIHGLSSLESGGTISITSRKENNKIIITIHDNGVGISDEKLDQIFNTSNNESIGVRNVKERLELFYHQEGLFRMESDNGVKTTIILPVKEL
jgi:sensor histidine kinase YesM